MPLTMAKMGEENLIKRIGGNTKVKQFLENLGFVVGGAVTVIVNVKDSRVAVSRELANNIMV